MTTTRSDEKESGVKSSTPTTHHDEPSPPGDFERRLNELSVGLRAVAEMRDRDFSLLHDRLKQLRVFIERLEENIPNKADLATQMADLRQRVNDIQSMEASLRDASLQTIRNSFQAEAGVVEQKISLGSQQRYTALEAKVDKTELTLQSQISATSAALNSQISMVDSNIQNKISLIDASIEARIRSNVIQGIVWGMGLVGGIIAIATAILKFLSPGR